MSHLGARGLDSYAGDIVGCMSSVSARVGHGVEVIPLCPVPIGGLGEGGLIRDIFDLDSWLHCSSSVPGDQLAGARTVLWEIIGSTTGFPLVAQPERMLFIPTNSRNPRRRSFKSVGIKTLLPAYLPPITRENEKRLIYALMEDLNWNFGVGIDPCPSLERGVVTQVIDSKQGRLVLVGASHMNRLAGVMGPFPCLTGDSDRGNPC
jgi:hypothetical protein